MKQYKITDKKIEQAVRHICKAFDISEQRLNELVVEAFEEDHYKVVISDRKLTITLGIAKKYFEQVEEEPLPF